MNARRPARQPSVKVQSGKDHQVIQPANLLRRKAAVRTDQPTVVDEDAIRRAEQALKALSTQFDGWMEEAAAKLAARWRELAGDAAQGARMDAFHRAAHDIRGQAATLGFPLAARVAASLCMLLENRASALARDPELPTLIGQHVDAIRAITREGVAMAEHPVGARLAAELEAAAQALLTGRDATIH